MPCRFVLRQWAGRSGAAVLPRSIDLADGDAVPKEPSEPGLQVHVEFAVAVAFGVLLGFVLARSCWPGCLAFLRCSRESAGTRSGAGDVGREFRAAGSGRLVASRGGSPRLHGKGCGDLAGGGSGTGSGRKRGRRRNTTLQRRGMEPKHDCKLEHRRPHRFALSLFSFDALLVPPRSRARGPVGLMDKASASRAGDSRFESWAGHCLIFAWPLRSSIEPPGGFEPTTARLLSGCSAN